MIGRTAGVGAGLAVVAIVAAAGYWWASGGTGPVRLDPGDAAVVARGVVVYREHCASCHGADLQGEADWRSPDAQGYLPAPPHDATGHTWHHPDDLLFKITKYGAAQVAGLKDFKTRMPVFAGTLEDSDIVAALSFIKSTWPPEIRRRHDAANAAQ